MPDGKCSRGRDGNGGRDGEGWGCLDGLQPACEGFRCPRKAFLELLPH